MSYHSELSLQLSLQHQVASVCKSCFTGLRGLRRIRCNLSKAAAISLANALISSTLDYCNSLYRGLSKGNLKKFQYVQNTMACIVTRTSKCSHITPVFKSCHWQVIFKMVTPIYKYLHSTQVFCKIHNTI